MGSWLNSYHKFYPVLDDSLGSTKTCVKLEYHINYEFSFNVLLTTSLKGKGQAFLCPDKWHYVPDDGACYRMLPRWREYTWKQANDECNMLFNMSSLWYLEEGEVIENVVQKTFASFPDASFWLAANYYQGMFWFSMNLLIFCCTQCKVLKIVKPT